MIATAKHKSGSSGSCLGYMLGDMLEKDQQVRVIGYNGFALSHLKIEEIEKVPTTDEERKDHKTKVWKIADGLSKIFDARAALADYRVNDPFEDYVISCTDGERERLRRVPTAEERKEYKMKELKDGETDDRTLEQILLDEFLAKIGVHGKIEKKLRRKSKKDGKKYTVKEIVEREAMFMAVAHDGTAHPHMHVLTARPDADGKVNDTRNERHRIAATVQALSKKYNLSLKLEGYEVDLEKTNEGYATRVRMRDAVKEACQTASSHEELYDLLAEKDMTPTWWVDADTAEDCGMTFTMKDKRGKKHTFSGTQLDRSCLTYSQVEAALARNLAARKTQEEAAQEAVQQEQKDILDGYRSAVLPVGNQIYDLKKSANELYKESKESGIAVSAATADVYKQLTATWEQYDDFNSQIRDAKDRADTVMAICGILTCLNPIVGLTVMFLAGIAEDIHRSSLIEQKKKLLARVESLRGDLDALKATKAALAIEKQDRLQQYLDAKRMYQEYRDSLNTVDQTVHDTHIDILEEEFPFKDKGHVQYIIHGPYDASIFRPEEKIETEDWDEYESWRNQFEKARQALKEKVMFVAGDKGPGGFYATLMHLQKQKNGNYRVGDLWIQPDGKVIFGQERVFGDPKLTEHSVPKIEEPIVQKNVPAVEKKPVLQEKPVIPRSQAVNTTPATPPRPQPSSTPSTAAKPSFEVVQEFKANYYKYRIKKEQDGLMKLQKYEVDKKSPVVNGKYTGHCWRTKETFTSYKEIGRDADGVYFKITDTTGKTRHINQDGVGLSQKKKQQLGLGGTSKGYGGPSV